MNNLTPIFDPFYGFKIHFCIFESSTLMFFLRDYMKNFNFVKIYVWGMIFIGNLILRTMVLEYFNNSSNLKSFRSLFRKIEFCTVSLKEKKPIHLSKYVIKIRKNIILSNVTYGV